MEVSGNTLVFVILGAAFAGVGVHLLLWSRRKTRLLRRFAAERGLAYRRRDDGRVARAVNDCVAIDDAGMGRGFGRVRDVVELGHGTLFRGVEALDPVPRGNPQNTHHARTAVLFPTSLDVTGMFLVHPGGEVEQRHPGAPSRATELRSALARASVPTPPCPLSLTLARGRALIYLEPVVTGALSEEHLDYLAGVALRLGTGPA